MAKYLDTIYPILKNRPPAERANLANKNQWRYFYKSLQVILSFWIVTILAITTQPWLDYWVKTQIKPPDSPQVMGQMIQNSITPTTLNTPTFNLKNSQVNIQAPIVEGIDDESLKKGIGHHSDSVWPDKKGNVVLAGHSFDLDAENPYGKVFISLRLVEINDEVVIIYNAADTHNSRKYYYRVFKKETVQPKDTSFFGKTDDWILTFYTCDPPYTDWKRLVLQAKLIKIE